MNILFSDNAWNDYLYWQQQDKKTLKRIKTLIKDCRRAPFEGIGKPERLKENLSGYWSRRISDEQRLVYKATQDTLIIVSLRYHYTNNG
ncbi:Txe/YoeB family addiction module toxin [Shewanella sp. Isolate13]|uniref:Txe/YoeB family addiction module toxin n=1 Tax=Shewanella sp. Isolate13 TaxID=2908531 RepID=UPI001EFDC21E|nr:Txe/YoeB family addiction module toxin [Shewanella sp. Isolate13]MCG9730960.1 Txe/YoeB family addiction module toxin [Shewanella sp. Isolate13]